ncbi:hypothetical protein D3C76_1565350 [compost metagenome]
MPMATVILHSRAAAITALTDGPSSGSATSATDSAEGKPIKWPSGNRISCVSAAHAAIAARVRSRL